jgi:basic amino acid/polyamine antiporter, APA family
LKQLFRKKNINDILQDSSSNEEHNLQKNLHLRDLVAFGIAAVVGAGIFSTIGNASYNGGPAVIFLFLFTAVACLFSALCYAEFASCIPLSGSAYTYAYTTFGELIAWILGWALVMEYAIGNIAVAISWSDYFTGLMAGIGLKIPEYLTMDYLSASRGFEKVSFLLKNGQIFKELPDSLKETYFAWQNAPQIGNFRVIADIPALFITVIITSLVYIGIKESKNASNIMVVIKLLVVALVIVVGAFYVKPDNWSPFAPNGLSGVLKGVSAVFFAYIGFDAISTTAEECKNPQRDLPRAMLYSLAVCTVLYVLIALVLTGMVSYKELQVGDPLAHVFALNDLNFMAGIIATSAVVTITSVFLVFQLGQPRILMTMSRDGLLPEMFAKIHPKYKTPYISTIATGLLVAIPALFLNLTEVTDLTSIGTLFAFTLVSGGILLLDKEKLNQTQKNRFRVPVIGGRFVLPLVLMGVFGSYAYYNNEEVTDFFNMSNQRVQMREKIALEKQENQFKTIPKNTAKELTNWKNKKASLEQNRKKWQEEQQKTTWEIFVRRIPLWVFGVLVLVMLSLTGYYNLSLIPVMGLLTNFYLMTELGIGNWIGFGVWMLVGLSIYFSYGYHYSKLKRRNKIV